MRTSWIAQLALLVHALRSLLHNVPVKAHTVEQSVRPDDDAASMRLCII
jgi:hypothetical protein